MLSATGPESLDGGYARVRRAEHHLIELRIQIEQFRLLWGAIDRPIHVAASTTGSFLDTSLQPSPAVSILIGEVVYNLRAALDYLVFGLALLDSKEPQAQTQFPIVDDPKRWPDAVKRHLTGVSNDHVERIRALQPFSGTSWTALLRDLSNPDKHRFLTPLDHTGWVKVVSNSSTDPRVINSPRDVNLLFADDKPVLVTLAALRLHTESALDTFRPEFSRE